MEQLVSEIDAKRYYTRRLACSFHTGVDLDNPFKLKLSMTNDISPNPEIFIKQRLEWLTLIYRNRWYFKVGRSTSWGLYDVYMCQ